MKKSNSIQQRIEERLRGRANRGRSGAEDSGAEDKDPQSTEPSTDQPENDVLSGSIRPDRSRELEKSDLF